MKKIWAIAVVLLCLLLFSACSSNEFTITFDVAEGNETINSQTVKKGDKITRPADPTREGYTFVGWYVNDEKWVFIEHTVTQDLTLTAKWSHQSCVFTAKSETADYLKSQATCQKPAEYYYKCAYCNKADLETSFKGEVASHRYVVERIASQYLKSDATCTAPAEYYYKCEWCNSCGIESYEYGEKLSHKYTDKSQELIYLKSEATCQQNAVYYYKCESCEAHGNSYYSVPGLGVHNLGVDHICTVCSGAYIYFGEFPQTLIEDGVTVTSIMDSRGYYLGSDGNYYAKVTAKPNGSNYTFSTGESILNGDVYYFRVEPICWRILSQESNSAMILCDSIIANMAFDKSGSDCSNNYAQSDIRLWLNNQFYNTSFTALEKQLILTTMVDNSAGTTGDKNNTFACENTEDYIFLLSYADVINPQYGFSNYYWDSDDNRQMKTSDYSRATGADTSTYSDAGNGLWWLRSPYYSNVFNNANRVGESGYVYNETVSYTNVGVVPALRIVLMC